MKFTQGIKMALSSIRSNKMRSILTMLGIIIGILSVIVLVGIGQGTTRNIQSQIEGLGTNLITVNIRSYRNKPITDDEITQLKSGGFIKEIAPIVSSNSTVKAGTKSDSYSVEGSVPAYEEIRNVSIDTGRFISENDITNRYKVAVIGTDIADTIFGTRDVIGKTIQINRNNFTVVGLLKSAGSSSSGSNDEKVIIPISTAERLFKTTRISTFYIEASSSDNVTNAYNQLNTFLYQKFGSTDDYNVFNQTDLLSTVSTTTNTLTMMLGGIASISLLVGGIGIMNIMLVSVTERTREIGIRKAIGAKRRNILIQFLIESVVLSVLGGIIGILLGFLVANIVSKFTSIAVSISPTVVLLSFSFAMAVGIIFGMYPANKASKLKPIDALRYE
ncbi:MAG: ABC transporter permease [Bacillota bacterium]|nr:ABC transporter permease [Bacillota bacterium]